MTLIDVFLLILVVFVLWLIIQKAPFVPETWKQTLTWILFIFAGFYVLQTIGVFNRLMNTRIGG